MARKAPGVRINFKRWITSCFPFAPAEKKGTCDKKALQIMCRIQIAVKYGARAHLPTAKCLTFLHSLEAGESSGPLKAMNSACVRVCWISEGVLLCVSHRRTRQLRPAHWNTWRGALHKAREHIQSKHAQPPLISTLLLGCFWPRASLSLVFFFLPSLKHSAAYLKMLPAFVLCHLFHSNVLLLTPRWRKTTDTVIWILATFLLPSSWYFVFSFSVQASNIRLGQTCLSRHLELHVQTDNEVSPDPSSELSE